MSVNIDVGVSVPPGHFGAADLEARAETVSLDWIQDLTLAVGAALGVLVSCSLSVLIFLS
jgi:hypothetical protein